MTVIKWHDSYNTGVDQFDQEHRKLVELINTMYGAVRDGSGKEVVATTCNELVAYTDYHFSNEEQVLAAVNYPGLAEHKVEHDSLKAKALDFQTRINAGLSDGGDLYRFLRNWLVDHIQDCDKRSGAFLNERKGLI